ncbi:MAG: YcxB family protein [Hyphomicrobiales bacterium]|nr:YcxB family protein [Hyphomicrobiales bacterium]
MRVAFRYEAQDHVEAQRLHARLRPGGWLFLAAIALTALTFAYFRDHDLRALAFAIFGGAASGALGLALYRYGLLTALAKRTYARYPLAQLERSVTLTPEGLRYFSARGDYHLQWSDLIGWRANDKMLLLYTAPRLFVPVPARLAALGFPFEAMKQAVAAHLPQR